MTVADQAIREQALDASRSFIVQAPAGSGKTELLIQRYLALLATVDEPEGVLAITFTRKAVAEMRERVIDALRAARRQKPRAAHKLLTWRLADQAMRRSDERQWNLPEQPARLRIMTIDSLNASLVGSMPWLSGIGAGVAVAKNADFLYEEAAWQTLDSRQADKTAQRSLRTLLLHLDNNDRRVMRLLCGLLAKRDQWLRYLVPLRSSRDKQEQREQLTRMFVEVIEEQLAALHARILTDIGRQMAQVAAAGAGRLDKDSVAAHAACRGLRALPAPTFASVAQWQGLARLYLTTTGDWRRARGFNKTLGFPPGCTQKAAIEALCAQLRDNHELCDALKDVWSIPETIYQDSQWELLAALIELLPVAVARLKLIFRQRGMMDFVEQSLAAGQALAQGEEATDLAMKLDYRLRHILMDEFQDTSHSQLDLLEKLLDGWQPDDGRSLFLVGDPMQSIYSFREADVSGFLKVRDHGIAGIRPQPLTLETNFRSTPELVRWFNKVFPDVLADEDNLSLGAVSYTGAVSGCKERADSRVTVHAGLDRERATEAQQLMQQIQQCLRQDAGQSIGVLVRSRSHLHELFAELKAGGVEFQALDILPLTDRPVIRDLLSVTRSLLHRHDRIAWLAVLRAPWCGLTLESLHHLTADRPHHDLWSLMNDAAIRHRLKDDERSRLQKLTDCYQRVLDHADRLTLRTKIQWLWRALGADACHTGAARDTQTYLHVIDELSHSGKAVTPTAIEEAMRNVYSSAAENSDTSDQPSVWLMTIHRAKGLQFDTVILPALERGARTDEKHLLAWHEERGAEYDTRLLLAPIHAPGGNDQSFDFVRQREQRRKALETQRLLYVAITRARSQLHLFATLTESQLRRLRAALKSGKDGSPGGPKSGSFLSLMIKHLSAEFESLSSADATPEPAARTPLQLKRVPLAWRPSITGENVKWQADDQQTIEREHIEFSWAGQAARLVGTLTHQYLRQMGERSPGLNRTQWNEKRLETMQPSIAAGLLSLGLPQDVLTASAQKVINALANIIRSEKARWILAGHAEARNEYAVSGVINGRIVNRVIDRTFIDRHGTFWIIDYKTSSHEGGNLEGFLDEEQARYATQLNEYAQLLGAPDERPVRLGLYFPLMDGWREWAAG